jgi:hypothetical protein
MKIKKVNVLKTQKIYYVGFYDIERYAFEKRVKSIAAVNKMNYVASAIESAGYSVEIVSPSWTADNIGFYKNRITKLSENISLNVGPTFGANGFFTKRLRILLSWIWLFSFLIRKAQKDEKIIVYHSMMAIYPIYYAQKIKKFKIILELNEIYQDAAVLSKRFKKLELKVIYNANSYILSTELLLSKVRADSSSIINYGNYNFNALDLKYCDGKIHVVYAGIIDKQKAGAFNALECAQFLTNKYVVHLIGFGNDNDVNELKKNIEINNQKNGCKVIFDGLKSGNDYIEYVSKCHIGLSTQTPDGGYNLSSFPSKVLSYLSMGLRVVSVYIEVIKKSKIDHLMVYYMSSDGKSIADAIVNVDLSTNYDNKNTLSELNLNFINDLKQILI